MTSIPLKALRQFVNDVRLYRKMDLHSGDMMRRPLIMIILQCRGLWVLETHRLRYYAACRRNPRSLWWWLARIMRPIATYVAAVGSKSQILAECRFGQDVYLSNRGHIICGAQEIGNGSVIHDHCTLGAAKVNGRGGRPIVGRNVWIGPNCVIVGSVTIGDGATILPGAFVTFSVGSGAVVAGNPARVTAEMFDNSTLRSSSAMTYDASY